MAARPACRRRCCGEVHARDRRVAAHPEVEPRLIQQGFDVVGNSPEEFAAFQEAEIARWRRVVQAGNIRPE